MTRYLSSALGAPQPYFGQSILQLERASGWPKADIRLSSELTRLARTKIAALGLDPLDTTGPELFGALQTKFAHDDGLVRGALGIAEDDSPLEVLGRVQSFLQHHEETSCFSIKPSVAKKLLKKKPPKITMKRLGYRSLESMLKHEPVWDILAAATMTESPTWHHTFKEQYAKLQPADLEQRSVTFSLPSGKRWQEIAETYVGQTRHNILCFKDLGAVVILPMSARVDGLAITAMLLALRYANEIHTFSSFIKLQQVKPGFGRMLLESAASEPYTSAQLAGQRISWKVIQRYYGQARHGRYPVVFEPHVQPEDFVWRDAESVLVNLQPALEFWEDTQVCFMLCDDGPVSMNILDVALSYCNHLPFQDRIVHFMREHVWHELIGRYLHQGNLEEIVQEQLASDLESGESVSAIGQGTLY